MDRGIPWRYSPRLAKTVNARRENGKKMFDEWGTHHGPTQATAHAYVVPHRCLAGRWHHVFKTEARFKGFGADALPVLQNALARTNYAPDDNIAVNTA
eukprot:2567517-Lingulodinium_polyedra.AAC.1